MSKKLSKLNNSAAKISLVLQGYKYQAAKQYLQLKKEGHPNPKQLKTMMRVIPFNHAFDKMLNDILSAKMVLQECGDRFAAPYALVLELDGQKQICPRPEASGEITKEPASLLAFLRKKGALLVRNCGNMYPIRFRVWRFENGQYYADDAEMTEREMTRAIEELPVNTLICEYAAPAAEFGCRYPILHLTLVRQTDGCCVLAEEYLTAAMEADQPYRQAVSEDPRMAAATDFADYVSRKFRELGYIHLSVLLTENGFTVMQLDTGRDLPYAKQVPAEVERFLEKERSSMPKLSPAERVQRIKKYAVSWQAKRKGFLDFMYQNWLRGLKDDNRLRCTTAGEKKWAHRRGFYSYRIKQYHLTEDNCKDILSDYDYKWLRPLNCQYHKWLWDKLMAYFVLTPYQDCIPKYYYRIVPENGKNVVIPYEVSRTDCTAADVVALLKEKGKLALKPAVGSHGEGFYKLEFADGSFFMNGKAAAESAVKSLLDEIRTTYIVSEYIEMHRDLKRIYDKVACTIRVMTIRNGTLPVIKSAYFRIGTSFTGNTDNLGSGGIAVPVDVETGHFGNAELLVNHEFKPCPVHPDTGAAIEGRLPNWEEVKAKIEEICEYLAPLEYLGFDIVITDDGLRILEINTHQDLHKYPTYPQEVKDYFRRKLILKGKKS